MNRYEHIITCQDPALEPGRTLAADLMQCSDESLFHSTKEPPLVQELYVVTHLEKLQSAEYPNSLLDWK